MTPCNTTKWQARIAAAAGSGMCPATGACGNGLSCLFRQQQRHCRQHPRHRWNVEGAGPTLRASQSRDHCPPRFICSSLRRFRKQRRHTQRRASRPRSGCGCGSGAGSGSGSIRRYSPPRLARSSCAALASWNALRSCCAVNARQAATPVYRASTPMDGSSLPASCNRSSKVGSVCLARCAAASKREAGCGNFKSVHAMDGSLPASCAMHVLRR